MNNVLYNFLLEEQIKKIRRRINREKKVTEQQKTRIMIKDLLTSRKKRPSPEDITVFLNILEQELPLFSHYRNIKDIISLAKDELNVDLPQDYVERLYKVRPSVKTLFYFK